MSGCKKWRHPFPFHFFNRFLTSVHLHSKSLCSREELFWLERFNLEKGVGCKEEADIRLFITLVPNVLCWGFIFRWPTTLGTFIEFWLVGSLSYVSYQFNQWLWSTEGVTLFITIRNEHQFNCNCLISLDPWVGCRFPQLLYKYGLSL